MPLRPLGLLDASSFSTEQMFCGDCRRDYTRVTGFVQDDHGLVAAYYAVCHGHPGHEVALDVVLGWESDHAGNVTFSCRVRPGDAGAMLVDPFVTLSFSAGEAVPDLFGTPLSRAAALAHPDLARLWAVVDAVVVNVPPLAAELRAPVRPRVLPRLRGH